MSFISLIHCNVFYIFTATAGKWKSNSTVEAFHADLRADTQAVLPQPTKVCFDL